MVKRRPIKGSTVLLSQWNFICYKWVSNSRYWNVSSHFEEAVNVKPIEMPHGVSLAQHAQRPRSIVGLINRNRGMPRRWFTLGSKALRSAPTATIYKTWANSIVICTRWDYSYILILINSRRYLCEVAVAIRPGKYCCQAVGNAHITSFRFWREWELVKLQNLST